MFVRASVMKMKEVILVELKATINTFLYKRRCINAHSFVNG